MFNICTYYKNISIYILLNIFNIQWFCKCGSGSFTNINKTCCFIDKLINDYIFSSVINTINFTINIVYIIEFNVCVCMFIIRNPINYVSIIVSISITENIISNFLIIKITIFIIIVSYKQIIINITYYRIINSFTNKNISINIADIFKRENSRFFTFMIS